MTKTDQAIHPLRLRLHEDMTLRGISQASQKTYVRASSAVRSPGLRFI